MHRERIGYHNPVLRVPEPIPALPGGLSEFLGADEIVPLPTLPAKDWGLVRRQALRRLAWHVCTLRSLRVHRGRPLRDAARAAWLPGVRARAIGWLSNGRRVR